MVFLYASHSRVTYDDTAAGQENIIFVPTPILQDQHDPYTPLAHALRLRQDIPASNLVSIEDGAHSLPIDMPQRVAQEVNGLIHSS